ncbi:MAG: AAA family ATPase [Desulfobaccales bacterium]
MENADSQIESFLPGLRRLDCLIQRAVVAAEAAYGPGAFADFYRGLYITQEEVAQLLEREPGASVLQTHDNENSILLCEAFTDPNSRLGWLARAFGLSPFDLDLILIALAPELDLRYERLYAYLQDDVTRKRPTVDLALNLLCTQREEKLARRSFFESGAPLLHHGLLRLLPDPHQSEPPLLAHYLKLDEQIVRFLLGGERLDPRLRLFCELLTPEAPMAGWEDFAQGLNILPARLCRAWNTGQPLRLYFHGSPGAGKRHAAEALAWKAGVPLLTADLAGMPAFLPDFEAAVKVLGREAWYHNALLFLDNLDALRTNDPGQRYNALMGALAADRGVTILAGTQPWVPPRRFPLGVLNLSFSTPGFTLRRSLWSDHLAAVGLNPDPADIETLAERFRLLPGQIAEAVQVVRHLWEDEGDGDLAHDESWPSLPCLFEAARAQCGHDLANLTRKIEARYGWEDIVLPPEALGQLRELCHWLTYRHQVLKDWGFDRKLSHGKGINALFIGPSGTGKTMAAQVISRQLGLDLYKIDLSGVVSKYIGETEKNLDRIFTAAENANAILFFDEADALFGKRSEVRDSHDRYANIEVSYLLQKMEEYEGVALLATNLRHHLDESFLRRLAFIINFPFPDVASRRHIWAGVWPAQTPVAESLDLDYLAQRLQVSGGNIKNIALAAAFLAAADGGLVTMNHVLQSTRGEYQKLGKVMGEELWDDISPAPVQGNRT